MNIDVAPELRRIMQEFDAEVDWSRVAIEAFVAEVSNRLRADCDRKLAIVQRVLMTYNVLILLNPDNEPTSEHNMFGPHQE